jgi:hypothetical protein
MTFYCDEHGLPTVHTNGDCTVTFIPEGAPLPRPTAFIAQQAGYWDEGDGAIIGVFETLEEAQARIVEVEATLGQYNTDLFSITSWRIGAAVGEGIEEALRAD